MSPVGDMLRNNIRLYPSLVNCCVIDCFFEWPEEALEAVARKLLMDQSLDSAVHRSVVTSCKSMHETMPPLAKLYLSSEGRATYVTPSGFFELLKTFTSLLKSERDRLEA
jgi:dynein heavy chain